MFLICLTTDITCGSLAAIEIPSIIQKGCRDEFVSLNQGGRIHLKMRFILAGEERKKIEVMVSMICFEPLVIGLHSVVLNFRNRKLTLLLFTHRE